jgi:hypothetical protein
VSEYAPEAAGRPDRLMQALEPIKAILEEDGVLDEVDLVVIEDIRSKLMKILADRAKQGDQMLQGKLDPRAARRLA